ncbi:MAG TPA: hypothetical protein VL974_00320, partial [Magnetospirillum sp.]|nr:hypothetical protein [Magnetospirillum sp.]
MNKVAVGAIVIVLAGAASFGTAVYPTMKARHEVEKALASLPAGSEGRYKNLDYSLFSGRLSLSDVELKIVQDGNAYVLRSPAVVIEDASETRLGKLTARDVVIEDPGQVQISALELTGDNLEGLALGDPTPNGKVDRLAMTGVTVSASGQSVKMREVVLSDFAVADKQARSLALGVHGLEMAAKDVPDADAQEMLTQLGYKTLALNFDFAFAHAPEAQRLTIKTIAFGGDEMGRITLTGTFGNVPTLAADDSFAAQAIAAGATLERMEVRYEDSSLTERLLKYAATQQGT